MYDIIIIGGSAAGLTAAIYATRRALKTLVLTAEIGGLMAKNSEIENWPGELKINGVELANRMKTQVENFGADLKLELVQKISSDKSGFSVVTSKGIYQGKTILLAFGKSPRVLKVPGEEKYLGRGVSYCATCDAPLYREKNVAVIGGGNSALDAAVLLSKIAAKVYIIHRKSEFRGDEYLIKKVTNSDKIEAIMDSELKEIRGNEIVGGVVLKDGKEIKVDGVFIEIGYIVNDSLIEGIVDIDQLGQVIVNHNQETSVPGIYAAGDLTNMPFQQLVIAAGEGATAALSAYDYIQKNF
ncbi:MAG: FAD-dependent oxidoreductase [Patescibacteria group bacterium]